MSYEPSGTYDEWRVTGSPGDGYDSYEFVWSDRLTPHLGEQLGRTPEEQARAFATVVREGGPGRTPWVGGPHLSRRTVTIGEWEGVTE